MRIGVNLTKVIFAGMLGLCGCATRATPDYYPNEKFRHSTSTERYAAEARCSELADQYVKEPNRYREIVKEGLVGGVIGAGTGAVGGAVFSKAGRGTGAGAAVGSIVGVLHGLKQMNEHSPSYERFVEHCLSQEGYKIIGWSSK